MKAEITTITPEIAKRILKNNDRNRRLRPATINAIARDMAEGRWKVNGESIILNGRTLIDGQHRLEACILADVSFKSVVVRGVQSDAIATVDTGMKRTLGDYLALMGESRGPTLAGAIHLGWQWDAGNPGASGKVRPTYPELIQWFEDNQEIREGVVFGNVLTSRPTRAPSSVIAVMATKAIRAGLTDEFSEMLEMVKSGADLATFDPLFHLRNAFIRNATSQTKAPRISIFARTIKAWNAHVTGEGMELLAWKGTGKVRREPFPAMVDPAGQPISFVPVSEAEVSPVP